MSRDLRRLLDPRSVAVVGGGAWCAAVVQQLTSAGFSGAIWPVHPTRTDVSGVPAYASIAALPFVPDACFVGVNRAATIDTIAALSQADAGGAVCFASGFGEVSDGADLNAALLKAAGDMPILGPNCYGYINNLTGALLWPDQHGCLPVDRGVAILTQSSNIAINLTMQHRALPISHVITCGNQAQTTQADIALALLDDPRVTAIGLHVEGFRDPVAWQTLARKAQAAKIPLVALKVGRSTAAQSAAVSHTASLAGADAGSQALLERLGIARVDDLETFLETLKILHVTGPLGSGRIATISCSGGEASLAADLAEPRGLHFPPLNPQQKERLLAALGPKVALANPLDYHTYIWRDMAAMTAAFSAMADPVLALTLLIVDFPRADRCDPADWACTIAAAKATRAATDTPLAMVATLPELMPEPVARDLLAHGIVPLCGLAAALSAVAAAIRRPRPDLSLDLVSAAPGAGMLLAEADAKRALAAFGVPIPAHVRELDKAHRLTAPLVLKGEGFAHKSEHGAVVLHLTHADLPAAAARMQAQSYLIEEMVTAPVAELLVGVTHDPASGHLLTIGAGGTLTELITDTRHLLLPTTPGSIEQALAALRIAPLLAGHRGKPAADMPAVIAAVMAIQSYVLANAAHVSEVEINPLICTPTGAIAADALIRIADD